MHMLRLALHITAESATTIDDEHFPQPYRLSSIERGGGRSEWARVKYTDRQIQSCPSFSYVCSYVCWCAPPLSRDEEQPPQWQDSLVTSSVETWIAGLRLY